MSTFELALTFAICISDNRFIVNALDTHWRTVKDMIPFTIEPIEKLRTTYYD